MTPPVLSLTLSPVCPPQNASQDLLGEALAQHIHQQIDTRGDHQLSHYSLAETWSHRMGTAHVSVLGEDGSAVSATSTINTPYVGPGAGGQAPLHPLDLSPPPPAWPPSTSLAVSIEWYLVFPSPVSKGSYTLTPLAEKAADGVALSRDEDGPYKQEDAVVGDKVDLWGQGQGGKSSSRMLEDSC